MAHDFAGGACVQADGSVVYNDTVNIFDTATKRWTALSFIAQGRAHMGAAAAGTELLIGGGMAGGGISAQVDVFDTTLLP